MNKSIAVALLALGVFATPARAVTIAWSPVGNPGNAPDPATANPPFGPAFGAVGYNYNIGTNDVTNNQYVAFLNSNDPNGTSPLALYNSDMTADGGISYSSFAASGSKYFVKAGDGNHPVTNLTWYDALRFANWINNGQTPGSTESGAYTLTGGTPTPSNASAISRSTTATVFLPNEDEWYKAAYYDPRTTAQGGPPGDSHYWTYGTTSNTLPTASAVSALPNHANFNNVAGNLTNVGAYTGTMSPAGAFDMSGNVSQWIENSLQGSPQFQLVRGGSYQDSPADMASSYRATYSPSGELIIIGFRLASVPEPSSVVLAALGLAGLVAWRWRGLVKMVLSSSPWGCVEKFMG